MTTSDMDPKTDYYAKSDSTSFPAAEKLTYYVEADGILNGLIIRQQEDRGEIEAEMDTVAGQNEYEFDEVEVAEGVTSQVHHVNGIKINYGNGFVPVRFKAEAELIAEHGTELESVLSAWPQSDPIYFHKGSHVFVYPAPTASEAGTNRLKSSVEALPVPLDRTDNTTPTLVPSNFHYLHPAYAAMSWLDEEDPLWKKAKRKWDEGIVLMLETIYPRTRQAEIRAGVPDDDGFDT